ncbi:DUF1827 family protein [Carnobacterium viridans]|nr:DUF1827 family protein [Carnobacterium viridans]
MMKLIDVTNNHSELVIEQLENTNANFIKVFSLGPTTVICSGSSMSKDVILLNESRAIKNSEINFVLKNILDTTIDNVEFIYAPNIVELSIPVED